MTAAQIHDVTARLLAMTHEQRAALPVMHPGRVDVIGGGAIVLRELVDATAWQPSWPANTTSSTEQRYASCDERLHEQPPAAIRLRRISEVV